MNKTKKICLTALGIALYVALSMTAKIPFIGHISLDLGYIVLAVYCWMFGSVVGGIVGAVGCTLVSILASGWFPPGWLVANLYIGMFCGWIFGPKNHGYSGKPRIVHYMAVIGSVLLGVGVFKTLIECQLYGIPLEVKAPKNVFAAVIDMVTMCVGLYIAPMIEHRINSPKNNSHDTARNAIRKLAQGDTDPSKYTDKELAVLSFIAHDKYQKTDMSFVDVGTSNGLSRLSHALYHHKYGYKYYMEKLVFDAPD